MTTYDDKPFANLHDINEIYSYLEDFISDTGYIVSQIGNDSLKASLSLTEDKEILLKVSYIDGDNESYLTYSTGYLFDDDNGVVMVEEYDAEIFAYVEGRTHGPWEDSYPGSWDVVDTVKEEVVYLKFKFDQIDSCLDSAPAIQSRLHHFSTDLINILSYNEKGRERIIQVALEQDYMDYDLSSGDFEISSQNDDELTLEDELSLIEGDLMYYAEEMFEERFSKDSIISKNPVVEHEKNAIKVLKATQSNVSSTEVAQLKEIVFKWNAYERYINDRENYTSFSDYMGASLNHVKTKAAIDGNVDSNSLVQDRLDNLLIEFNKTFEASSKQDQKQMLLEIHQFVRIHKLDSDSSSFPMINEDYIMETIDANLRRQGVSGLSSVVSSLTL